MNGQRSFAAVTQMPESGGCSRRSALRVLLGFGLPPSLWLAGCGGGSDAGGPNLQSSSVLLTTTKVNNLATSSPSCGGPSLPSCDGTYHLGIHTSGGVSGALVDQAVKNINVGVAIGPTTGAQVRPGDAYAFKAIPDNAKLWLQLNGKPIPDSGTWDLNLTPGFDNVLFAYIAIMPGDPAPDFNGLDANGQLHRLSALRGKWVLVTFGYPACPGTRNFASVLSSIYSQYHPRGLEVLSVLFAPLDGQYRVPNSGDLTAFSLAYGVNYPLIGDADDANQYYTREYLNCTYYSCTGSPCIFLIDPQGKIAYRYGGWDPQAGLDGVLAGLYP